MSCWKRIIGALLLTGAITQATAAEIERTGGPYVPTPIVVVQQMLRIGNIGPKDHVIDLGSGDGIIVLTAASQNQASGVGFEIDPELVKLSNAEAQKRGIADRARFQVQDVFKVDLSKATVVTTYLLPGMMMNLRQKIYTELKPGSRVVSHDYHFSDWRADDQFSFDVPEKEKVNGVPSATVYLWVIPAKVGGRWQVRVEGGEAYDVALKQTWQVIEGTGAAAGKPAARLSGAVIRGEDIGFVVGTGASRMSFNGKANGDTMQGSVDLGGGRSAKWTASRIAQQAAAN
jgi:hypothetical protein